VSERIETVCPVIDNASNNSNNIIIRGKNMDTGNLSNAFLNYPEVCTTTCEFWVGEQIVLHVFHELGYLILQNMSVHSVNKHMLLASVTCTQYTDT
jgi:hypothetical protein